MKPTKESTYLNTYHQLVDGSIVKIIKYKNCKDITIQFDYGFEVKTRMMCVKRDNIKHPLQKTVYNIGYIGLGSYSTSDNLVLYDKWSGTLRRCYDEKYQEKHPSYIGCSVAEDWHNFQNFAKWFEKNYNPETMHKWQLDKDILVKGNKIYSPETCCFVPSEINNLFIKRKVDRGRYCIGVSFNKRDKLYSANISAKNYKGKRNFKTELEAFNLYKLLKEKQIKEIADKWRGEITEEVYNAMYNYKVEITD
jgi:hypothetical protein